jgi:hypothetical protein
MSKTGVTMKNGGKKGKHNAGTKPSSDRERWLKGFDDSGNVPGSKLDRDTKYPDWGLFNAAR